MQRVYGHIDGLLFIRGLLGGLRRIYYDTYIFIRPSIRGPYHC